VHCIDCPKEQHACIRVCVQHFLNGRWLLQLHAVIHLMIGTMVGASLLKSAVTANCLAASMHSNELKIIVMLAVPCSLTLVHAMQRLKCSSGVGQIDARWDPEE
jgi:hypothetical protein